MIDYRAANTKLFEYLLLVVYNIYSYSIRIWFASKTIKLFYNILIAITYFATLYGWNLWKCSHFESSTVQSTDHAYHVTLCIEIKNWTENNINIVLNAPERLQLINETYIPTQTIVTKSTRRKRITRRYNRMKNETNETMWFIKVDILNTYVQQLQHRYVYITIRISFRVF